MRSVYIDPHTFKLSAVPLLLTLMALFGFTLVTATQAATAKRDITVEDLVTIRDIQTMELSPNGKFVAFQTVQRNIDNNDFTVAWHIAETKPGAKARVVGTGREVEIDKFGGYLHGGEIVWTPDSNWIYFTKKQDGKIQIWRSNRSNSQAQQVTHKPGDTQTLQMDPSGKAVYFTVGRTYAEIAALKKQGARNGYLDQNPPLYYIALGPIFPPCTDGKSRSTQLNESLACLLTNWIYDITTEEVRPATTAELDALPAQDDSIKTIANMGIQMNKDVRKKQTLSPDKTQLAWIQNADPEINKGVFPDMVLTAMKDEQVFRCPAPQCISQDLVGFGSLMWHPNGKEIILTVTDGPHHSLHSFYGWTPGEKTVRTILRSDDSLSSCQITGLRLICNHESWTSPKHISALNIDTGKITTLVDVNPDFQNIRFTKVEKILGEDDYGHKVYGHLVYPKDYKKGQKYPLVVTQYHSYGFLRGATGVDQPIHVLARDGIAVLSFDHRQNNAEYNKTAVYPGTNLLHFKNLFIKQGPATAVENMVDMLVKRGIANPAHIGATGFSYGDQVLSTMLLRRNYTAVSTTSLQTVPVHNMMQPSSNTGKAFNEIFGEPFSAKGLKMRLKYSLEAQADKIDSPILLNIADREANDMSNVYNALRAKNKVLEIYYYPDELHVKWQPAHQQVIYHRNLDWFKFWLQGVEDANSDKAAQYDRWRGLREKSEANMKQKMN